MIIGQNRGCPRKSYSYSLLIIAILLENKIVIYTKPGFFQKSGFFMFANDLKLLYLPNSKVDSTYPIICYDQYQLCDAMRLIYLSGKLRKCDNFQLVEIKN